MTSLPPARRALLLGALLGATACDVAEFASSPMPRLEQTWNLPAPDMNVSVASLLPANTVTILPDSTAFSVSVSGANITRRVGADCAQCESLHGTNAAKPAFVLTAANSSTLPADVVTAAVTAGSVNVQLTNSMSFDPLFVRNNPATQSQGFMLIVVRSGSLVLGRDSVNGATTTFAPGTQMTRVIPLNSGTITGSITVDVTLDSPLGDHNEFIDANGTLDAVATVPTLHVASVGVNVPGRTLDSETRTISLNGLGEVGDKVIRGALEMTINNPFSVTGTVGMRFAYGPGPTDAITKTIGITPGVLASQRIQLDSTEMALLMGKEIEITVTGSVSSTGPITVTPRQEMRIANRMILRVRTGGGN